MTKSALLIKKLNLWWFALISLLFLRCANSIKPVMFVSFIYYFLKTEAMYDKPNSKDLSTI